MGGDELSGSSVYDRTNNLLDQQILDQQHQIEQEQKSLFETKLNIFKSQGQQNWNSAPTKARPGPSAAEIKAQKARKAEKLLAIGKGVVGWGGF